MGVAAGSRGCEDAFVPSGSVLFTSCACRQQLFTYVCVWMFGCEAHFNMIIVPACVCGRSGRGHAVMEGFTRFTVGRVFVASPWAESGLGAGPDGKSII